VELYLYSSYLLPQCKRKILPFISSTIFWYGVFSLTLFMIMCVTNVFNFSVFTLIKGYLRLVPAIVDGNMMKCFRWPKVKYVTYLRLSDIFIT
jgi:hypothetical protein